MPRHPGYHITLRSTEDMKQASATRMGQFIKGVSGAHNQKLGKQLGKPLSENKEKACNHCSYRLFLGPSGET